MAFDVDAYIKEGRRDIRNSIAAYEAEVHNKTDPLTSGVIDHLLARQADNRARLEACILLCDEHVAELKKLKERI